MARVLATGGGAPVWELREILLRYSSSNHSGAPMRRLVESGKLADFARQNPQLRVVTRDTPGAPSLFAQYVTGQNREVKLGDMNEEQILKRMSFMRDTSSSEAPEHRRLTRGVMKPAIHTVQGFWKGKPHMWEDATTSTATRDRHELKLRKLFRELNNELGLGGTSDVLRRMRKKEQSLRKVINANYGEDRAHLARDALRGYYSQVYVPEQLERDRLDQLRAKKVDPMGGDEVWIQQDDELWQDDEDDADELDDEEIVVTEDEDVRGFGDDDKEEDDEAVDDDDDDADDDDDDDDGSDDDDDDDDDDEEDEDDNDEEEEGAEDDDVDHDDDEDELDDEELNEDYAEWLKDIDLENDPHMLKQAKAPPEAAEAFPSLDDDVEELQPRKPGESADSPVGSNGRRNAGRRKDEGTEV